MSLIMFQEVVPGNIYVNFPGYVLVIINHLWSQQYLKLAQKFQDVLYCLHLEFKISPCFMIMVDYFLVFP